MNTNIKKQQVATTRQEPKGIYRFRLAEDPGHGLACILENIRSHNTVHGNVGLQIHSRHGASSSHVCCLLPLLSPATHLQY